MKEYKNLLAAIMLQAAKDYVDGNERTRAQILRDLRSKYMIGLSDGQSEIIAEQLEHNCAAIKARLRKMRREEE